MARRVSSLDRLTARLARLPSGMAADARVSSGEWVTMRYANGWIHQPHVEVGSHLSLRAYVDGRLATATTTDLSDAGFDRLVGIARTLARAAPKEPKFPGFPAEEGRVRPVAARELGLSSIIATAGRLATAALTAARTTREGSRISGAVHVGVDRIDVANTAGLARSTVRSMAESSVLVEDLSADPPASGWAEGAHWDPEALDTAKIGRSAASRVARSPARSAKPGRYRVVLRAPAVAELLGFLGHLGFNGHAELEGWSCLHGKRGRRIAPTSVTLVDDARSTAGLPVSIDFEGLAKRATPLIDRGVAKGAVTDLVTAGRLGTTSSGHGLPPESPWGEIGPTPTNLVLSPGDASEAEMIRETKRGLLVTRFHYVRVVHPGKGTITGMTRDGTYAIEDGEIVGPVRNLRFTESVLTAVRGIELIGRTPDRLASERAFSSMSAPAVLTAPFQFNSSTVF